MSSIPVQVAVSRAKKSLLDLYADDPPKELALEEIEFLQTTVPPMWSVTLGFNRYKPSPENILKAPFGGLLVRPEIENRVYKTVLIDANTGEFVKMDMRLVQ